MTSPDVDTGEYMDPALRAALDAVRVKGVGSGEKLKEYWTEGAGAAKIRWGTPGDFMRCVRHLEKYIADPKGYCSDMHVRATGARPGHAASEQRSLTTGDNPMGDNAPSPVELFGGPMFMRSFPLEDIHVKPDGDGRTVEAYAAVFDVEAEIMDAEGHYREVIDRGAFDKVLSRAKSSQGWRVGVFYNHGMTIHGTPSERGSVPVGTPEDIRVDGRGLFTVTSYNKTALAEEVLEAIRSGGITAQSFTGRIIRSDPSLSRPQRRRGGYLPVNGQLQTVRRMELGLAEYGATPMPAYADAEIMGVRMLNQLYLSDEDRAETPDESEPVATEVAATDPFHRRIHAAMRARGL